MTVLLKSVVGIPAVTDYRREKAITSLQSMEAPKVYAGVHLEFNQSALLDSFVATVA